jgi:hypothetical protein
MVLPEVCLGKWDCWETQDLESPEPRGSWSLFSDRIETPFGNFNLLSITTIRYEGREAYELKFSKKEIMCYLWNSAPPWHELVVLWQKKGDPDHKYSLLRPYIPAIQGKKFSLEILNPFGRQFAEMLFKEFPEWREFARLLNPCSPELEPREGFDFIVEVPTSPREYSGFLTIRSDLYSECAIVGIGPGHADFADWYDNRGKTDIFTDAIKLIHEIIEEKYIGVRYKNNHSGLISPEKLLDQKDISEVISWKGTYNKKSKNDGK